MGMQPTKTTPVYELKNTINGIRRGIITTRAGKVDTPVFMPVGTRAALKGLTNEQIEATGAQIILNNTYHLHLKPGESVIKSLGGLHEFTRWNKPILTDSGGFQVFSLGHVNKITDDGVTFNDPTTGDEVFLSPEKAMQIQVDLGSDIIMAFDDVVGLDKKSRNREEEAFERTHMWLERCTKEFKRLTKDMPDSERPLLFGIAQGGLDKSLRKCSLEIVQSSDVDGVAVGGLSVGEPRKEMHEMLDFLAPLYDPSKAHYLMGIGEPVDMRYAMEHGIDMFDCVLPTRNGRHGTAWVTGDKKIHLTNAKYAKDKSVIDENCDCYTCKSGYQKGYLRHLFKVNETLAGSLVSIHNIRYLNKICEEYRSKV